MPLNIVIRLKDLAKDLGFCCVGICPAVEPPHYGAFLKWLEAGYHGEMHYLAQRKEAYRSPSSILPGARSLIMLGFPYQRDAEQNPPAGYGLIARYANGPDYHKTIRQWLRKLGRFLQAEYPSAAVRGVVDTAPLLERDFAQLAGLGWIGKNTLLIGPDCGSFTFLAALLTTAELDFDPPFAGDRCGSCSACLRACPTGALVSPRVLDARRCLSYLTIELRGFIPRELRELVGNWFFGCDLCQEVCPWNRRLGPTAQATSEATETRVINLIALFRLKEDEFHKMFGPTALWRAKRRGLLRNAAIVLGNQRSQAAWDVLVSGLEDSEPVVREACAWALARIDIAAAGPIIRAHLAKETDPAVAASLSGYLAETSSSG